MYKITNKIPARIQVDPDGMVRITARILQEDVLDYLPSEMEAVPSEIVIDGMLKEYIPASEFTESALATLEGKPVLIGSHEWQAVGADHKESRVVGAVAGSPHVVDGGIECDFVITDADTIEKLKGRKLHDVSAGYELDFDPTPGEWQGIPYSGTQKNLRFNHVLLLGFGEGRGGADVRVFNNKPLEGKQVKVIKTTVGNRAFEYRFNSDEDAAQAEKMVDDQKLFNADELAAAMEEQASLKKQIEELQAQYDEAMKTIEAQKAEIEKLFSTESLEELAAEAAEQKEDEEIILDEAVNEDVITDEEKENIKVEAQNASSFAGRRKAVIGRLFKAMNCDISKWDENKIDAAFEMKAAESRLRAKNRKATVLNGKRSKVENSAPMDNRARMLRPMKPGKGE